MTIFSIYLFLMMLLVGGIAVDLMLAEYERTKRQSVLDRALLAAADLDQKRPPTEVVEDYFAKAGLGGEVTDIVVAQSNTARTVSARANTEQATRWMKFMGNPTLPVITGGTAEQVIPELEVSLVLDISGSMRFSNRMDDLRPAAKSFVATLLEGDLAQFTSINLIPYAGQTNPGAFMFNRMGGVRYPAAPMNEADGGILEAFNNTVLHPATPAGTGSVAGGRYVYPNNSSCIEIAPNDFTYSGLPNTGSPDQVAHFMNWSIAGAVMDWGWCPEDDTAIQYASNNITHLETFIDNMRMHDGTGTHYAIKYGLALLDPSSRDDFDAMANAGLVPDAFRGRPADWGDERAEKFIVLMTDGQITEQVRPRDTMHPENPTNELAHRGGDRERISTAGTNVQSFYDVCDLAKDPSRNVVIYTIAFEAPSAAKTQMRNCASSPSHFFDVADSELNDAFESIARAIRPLRLSH
ncbi:MAG: Tad domain-containing protein [Pseudomonadota bacterium]